MEQLCRAQPLPSVSPAIPEGHNYICPSLTSLLVAAPESQQSLQQCNLGLGRTHVPVLSRAAELGSGAIGAQSHFQHPPWCLQSWAVPEPRQCWHTGEVCRWPAGPAGAEHPWVPPVPGAAVLSHTRNCLCHGATKALVSLPGCVQTEHREMCWAWGSLGTSPPHKPCPWQGDEANLLKQVFIND